MRLANLDGRATLVVDDGVVDVAAASNGVNAGLQRLNINVNP